MLGRGCARTCGDPGTPGALEATTGRRWHMAGSTSELEAGTAGTQGLTRLSCHHMRSVPVLVSINNWGHNKYLRVINLLVCTVVRSRHKVVRFTSSKQLFVYIHMKT